MVHCCRIGCDILTTQLRSYGLPAASLSLVHFHRCCFVWYTIRTHHHNCRCSVLIGISAALRFCHSTHSLRASLSLCSLSRCSPLALSLTLSASVHYSLHFCLFLCQHPLLLSTRWATTFLHSVMQSSTSHNTSPNHSTTSSHRHPSHLHLHHHLHHPLHHTHHNHNSTTQQTR